MNTELEAHLLKNPQAGMARQTNPLGKLLNPPTKSEIEKRQAALTEACDRQRHEEEMSERRSNGLPVTPFPPDVARREAKEAEERQRMIDAGEIVDEIDVDSDDDDDDDGGDGKPLDIAIQDADPVVRAERKKRVAAAKRKAEREAREAAKADKSPAESDAEAGFENLSKLSGAEDGSE